MAKIRNNLQVLIASKGAREGARITYDDISQATRISPNTLSMMMRNKITRFDERTLTALCDYFDVSLDELLSYHPRQKKAAAEAALLGK